MTEYTREREMTMNWKKTLDDVPDMSAQDLRNNLLDAIAAIRQYGVGNAMVEVPDLPARIMRRMVKLDAAMFAGEAPELLDEFIGFFWECADAVAERTGRLRLIQRFAEGKVNIEADDSPFTTCFQIDSGRLTGGSGQWSLKDQNLKYFGPTEKLMRLLTGDIDLQRALFTTINFEGHPLWLTRLGPIMVIGIPSLVRGH